jgi:hypothetical protein
MTLDRENVVVGRLYTDSEVAQLQQDWQPDPVRPYAIDRPAPGRGVGHTRVSSNTRAKWCAYCQTPINKALRAKSCGVCAPLRVAAVERMRTSAAPGGMSNQERDRRNVMALLQAVDELTGAVGLALAHRNSENGMRKRNVDDLLYATKKVVVAADAVRGGGRQPG